MSIWSDLGKFLSSFVADAFSTVVERVRVVFEGNTETRRKVAFSIAIIALSAKMAKADGVVTRDEVAAFREIFEVPADEFDNVSRLFNLAKQDIAGFDAYAAQVRTLFPGSDPSDTDILKDVLDALFHIAKADGFVHENELLFLEEIAVVFGFSAAAFDQIKIRHTTSDHLNPYRVLGAEPHWDFKDLKAHYRRRVAETHPDKLLARGVPKEFILIATERLASLNAAWEILERSHRDGKLETVSAG